MTNFRSYAEAGVNRKEEDESVASITSILTSTFNNQPGRVMAGIGHFANLIDIGNGQALVMSTDGVGSKMMIAERLQKYDTVGIDMVAMNVNDILCLGATPIALVDYLAVEKHDPAIMKEIARGIKRGADEAGIAVIGGETATLPDMIKGLDLAGTTVGLVDKDKVVTGEAIEEGDVLIGLPSSGIHSNGLTLARKVLDLNDVNVLAELLTPTKIYVEPILDLLEKVKVKGMAHMTGGGLLNLKRLNEEMGFNIERWPEPQGIFEKIKNAGNIPEEEMYKTFNMGIGFCVVVSKGIAVKALDILDKENPTVLGHATKGNEIMFKKEIY